MGLKRNWLKWQRAPVIEFVKLGALLLGLTCAAYGAACIPLRLFEYAVSAKLSPVRPKLGRFLGMHLVAIAGVAVFTPAVVYVLSGLLFKAGGFTDPGAFNQSLWFWAMAWLAGLLLPVQFHYSLNRRMFSDDAEQTVRPAWLMLFWGVNSCLAATLMWLPLWLGWVTLPVL